MTNGVPPIMRVVECPNCQCGGRAIHGFNNNGSPRLGGPCGRCHAAGFVPELDGEPSWPFHKDKDHPLLLTHAAAYPTVKTLSPDRIYEQRGME